MSLTLHHQKIPAWFGEFVNRTEGNLAFLVGVDVFPDVPGVTLLGRTYIPDGTSNALVDGGAVGANAWIDHFQQVYAANPHVDYWIGPNEYVLWSEDHAARFNAFHVQFIERMDDLGYRVCCGQINTGWPRLRAFGDPPPYPEALAPTLGCLWAHEGLFSLHEYWPGLNDPTGNILRYRKTRQALLDAGVVNLPDFVVTELGIDMPDPNAPQGHRGWRDFVDWPTYFGMLQTYAGELAQDDYMLGASIFTVADDWVTFQINEPEAMPLADWIATDEPPPPPPPPPPERARGIDVSQWQLDIDWQAVADSGVEFVFMRATVGLRVDPYFTQNWQGAGDAGLLRGVYHYLEPDTTGQAAHFVGTVGDRVPELGYWGDLEASALTADKCKAFLEAADRNIIEQVGRGWMSTCNVYTAKGFFDRFGTPDWVEGRKLWVAHWTDADEPTLPAAWDEWEFWQTTSDGSVPGIEGRVDLDVYNGTSAELEAEYGGGGPVSSEIRVYDVNGQEQDWNWLVANYGAITIQKPDADAYYKVVEIHEKHNDSAFIVKVLNAGGAPVVGKTALFYWPDAPEAPGAGWLEQGVGGTTNESGDVGFGMGPGAYYDPATQTGPHKAWLFGENVSEMFEGIGMVTLTNHNHVDITYQWVEDEEPIPPVPEDDIAAQLARIADALERIERDGILIRTS